MTKSDLIYVAGHRGMVGAAIVRQLQSLGFKNIITASSSDLDLRRQAEVEQFFATHKPNVVVLAAAKVGGILANSTQKADFLMDNLSIELNVIQSAHKSGVEKLLFLGSSCIYPKFAEQPLKEESLLTGSLEPTNEPYAIAKIAGIKMCETYREQYGANFISCMPTNLYGPGDNYDLKNSHVLPALIRKFHEAKQAGSAQVEIWGTGSPKREFLHVDDLAKACVFLLENYNEKETINVGTGEDISIKNLALLVKEIVGFEGELVFDTSKPDGTPRKLMNVSKINTLGWQHAIDLKAGITAVYNQVKTEW
jgi:GDP-L-fucose synthase